MNKKKTSTMPIDLILGPMFAGKSTELIRRARRFQTIKKKTFVVNHVFNNRYGSSAITTHDDVVLAPDLITGDLREALHHADYSDADVIIIEELQFFENAADVLAQMADVDHKHVIASGLSGSAERMPMGDISRIFCLADSIEFVTALCPYCGDGTPAPFSKRIVAADGTVDVGGADKYVAACRKHFLSA
jgi:thymidine kinase